MSQPASLSDALSARPQFRDVPIGDLTLRVKRCSLAEKLGILRMMAGAQNEDGKIESDEAAMALWCDVLSKLIVDGEGNAAFDCQEGRDFISCLTFEEIEALQDTAVEINGLSRTQQDDQLESAKNE